ncbi:nanos homolog 3-like [Culicoides brevitarsis]|uniref:nanos homolog 3-like n=1 Tax=Culicoides brevitarsis TaxID=469753 RepID=UPI00307B5416
MVFSQIPQWVLLGTSKEDFEKAKIDVLLNLSHLWVDPKPDTVQQPRQHSSSYERKSSKNKDIMCQFCKNNGRSARVYKSHDKKSCPVLNAYKCPTCGKNGHTVRYCPEKKIVTPEEAGMVN